MTEHTFAENVAQVLQTSLDGHGIALSADGIVVLTISRHYYEQHFGQLYQQVTQVIEQHFPERHEDLKLLFRTEDGEQQHLFRLWHNAA